MEKNKYFITFKENGEEKTIERIETEKELKERIKAYKQHNIKIIKVLKECIITCYIELNF